MEQVTTEIFSSQEQEIKELRETVRVHDKEINKLIEFLVEHVPGADFNLLNLRIDRDIRTTLEI